MFYSFSLLGHSRQVSKYKKQNIRLLDKILDRNKPYFNSLSLVEKLPLFYRTLLP